MSVHAKRAMLEEVRQSLIEKIADLLDEELHLLNEAIAGIKDPESREESELHIRMADAAFEVYKTTMVDTNT